MAWRSNEDETQRFLVWGRGSGDGRGTGGTTIDVASIKSRGTKKVEIVYKSPHPTPNGLQATRDGLWVIDQGKENWVSLINFADGKLIREFQVPGLAGASGITVDPMASSGSTTRITASS